MKNKTKERVMWVVVIGLMLVCWWCGGQQVYGQTTPACTGIADYVPELRWEHTDLSIERFDVWWRAAGTTEWGHLMASLCHVVPGQEETPGEPGSGWDAELKCAGLTGNASVPVFRWRWFAEGEEVEFAVSATNQWGTSEFSNVVCMIAPLTCDVMGEGGWPWTNGQPPGLCWMVGTENTMRWRDE